jgi:hypothetical protein
MPLLILTGASGSGKTAIAEAIESTRPGFADVFRFDRIGVPSTEAMVTGWGSDEAWQRAMSFDWLARIATLRKQSRPALFERQMRLAFVREGLLLAGVSDARVILVPGLPKSTRIGDSNNDELGRIPSPRGAGRWI